MQTNLFFLVWLGGSLWAVVQLKTLRPPYLGVKAETQADHTTYFLHLDTLQVKGGTPINYVGTSGLVVHQDKRSCYRDHAWWISLSSKSVTEISQCGLIRETENQENGTGYKWWSDLGKLIFEEEEANSGIYLLGVLRKIQEDVTSMKGIQNRRIRAKPKADMKRELEALSFFGRKGCFLLGVGAESGPSIV